MGEYRTSDPCRFSIGLHDPPKLLVGECVVVVVVGAHIRYLTILGPWFVRPTTTIREMCNTQLNLPTMSTPNDLRRIDPPTTDRIRNPVGGMVLVRRNDRRVHRRDRRRTGCLGRRVWDHVRRPTFPSRSRHRPCPWSQRPTATVRLLIFFFQLLDSLSKAYNSDSSYPHCRNP